MNDSRTQIPIVNSQPNERMIEDRFRPQYRVLSEEEKKLVGDIKEKASELARLMVSAGHGRWTELALTDLESSVVWAIKFITGPKA